MSNKISLALNGSKQPSTKYNGNNLKRPHAALQDEEDEEQQYGRSENVSHFDKSAGGAIDPEKKKKEGPLVIQKQANRDWRDAAKRKRQRSGLPEGAGNGGGDVDQRMRDVEEADKAKKPGFGLNLYKKENDGDADGEDAVDEQGGLEKEEKVQPSRPKTDDEIAMDALLGRTTKDNTLTIMSEEDAFRQDYGTAPEMASIDDYARVPVEQFGAALLRGMGWKEGEGIGSQKGKKLPKDINKLPERRANLLGIGAREDAALVGEMGTWGRGSRGGKEIKIYNPVLIKDKKTGKMYTEDELQKKKEQDEREKYEAEFEAKERKREKERRRDDGDRREKSDRRDRDRDRRKYDDEESDEDYRRKEKERRRRDRDREEDYDRERSRKHRERDGDRHRDRDRDRDRDRRRHHDSDRRDRDRDRRH